MVRKMISSLNIARILGYGNATTLIISSIVLVITLFFYIYTLGSYFHVGVAPLEHRVNYHESFSVFVINENTDHLIISFGVVAWIALSVIGRVRIVGSAIYGITTVIAASAKIGTLFDIVALISIPIVISLLIYNKLTPKKILHASNLPLIYGAIIGIVIGFVSIILSLAPLFFLPQLTPPPDYLYEISVLLSVLSPFLIFFLILGAPVKLVAWKFLVRIFRNKSMIDSLDNDPIQLRTKILYLSLFILLSITIALIPHQSPINHDNQQVGSDSGDYVNVIDKLIESQNSQEFIKNAFVIPFSSDRPLFSLFLFAIVKIVPANISYSVDHVPVILAPVLVLVVFFLTRELTSSDSTSLLASFLTAVSFHTLMGIYSGFYANWFALIIGYASFVFLIRFLKAASRLNLLVYSVLLILLVFTHVYTWTILTLFIAIFLGVMYKLNYYHKKSIIILLIVILSSVAIDVIRTILTGTSAGIASDVSLARAAGPDQVASLLSNLIDTTQNFSGGMFSNFMIFALAVYWLFRSNSLKLSSIFILIFFALAVLPLLFGNGVIQARMLYDIPFQIPAAIGLTYLKRHTNGILMISPICLWLVAMSIRTVSNFYFVSPS